MSSSINSSQLDEEIVVLSNQKEIVIVEMLEDEKQVDSRKSPCKRKLQSWNPECSPSPSKKKKNDFPDAVGIKLEPRIDIEILDSEVENFGEFSEDDESVAQFKEYLKSFCRFFKRLNKPVPYTDGDDILNYMQCLDITSPNQIREKIPKPSVSEAHLIKSLDSQFPNHNQLISDKTFQIFIQTTIVYWKDLEANVSGDNFQSAFDSAVELKLSKKEETAKIEDTPAIERHVDMIITEASSGEQTSVSAIHQSTQAISASEITSAMEHRTSTFEQEHVLEPTSVIEQTHAALEPTSAMVSTYGIESTSVIKESTSTVIEPAIPAVANYTSGHIFVADFALERTNITETIIHTKEQTFDGVEISSSADENIFAASKSSSSDDTSDGGNTSEVETSVKERKFEANKSSSSDETSDTSEEETSVNERRTSVTKRKLQTHKSSSEDSSDDDDTSDEETSVKERTSIDERKFQTHKSSSSEDSSDEDNTDKETSVKERTSVTESKFEANQSSSSSSSDSSSEDSSSAESSSDEGGASDVEVETSVQDATSTSLVLECHHFGSKERLCTVYLHNQKCQNGNQCSDSHNLPQPSGRIFRYNQVNGCKTRKLERLYLKLQLKYKVNLLKQRSQCQDCLKPELCLSFYEFKECIKGNICPEQHIIPANMYLVQACFKKYEKGHYRICPKVHHVTREGLRYIYRRKYDEHVKELLKAGHKVAKRLPIKRIGACNKAKSTSPNRSTKQASGIKSMKPAKTSKSCSPAPSRSIKQESGNKSRDTKDGSIKSAKTSKSCSPAPSRSTKQESGIDNVTNKSSPKEGDRAKSCSPSSSCIKQTSGISRSTITLKLSCTPSNSSCTKQDSGIKPMKDNCPHFALKEELCPSFFKTGQCESGVNCSGQRTLPSFVPPYCVQFLQKAACEDLKYLGSCTSGNHIPIRVLNDMYKAKLKEQRLACEDCRVMLSS